MNESRRSFISNGIFAAAGFSIALTFAAFLVGSQVRNPADPKGKWLELENTMKGLLLMANDLDSKNFNIQYAPDHLSESSQAIARFNSDEDVIACLFLSENGNPKFAHERLRFFFGKISPERSETIFRNLRNWPGTLVDAMWKYVLMGCKIKEVDKYATSFPFRQANMITSIDLECLSADNEVLEENSKWRDDFHHEMERYTSPNAYINFTDRRQKNHLDAYNNDHLERLIAVKRQLDPENIFSNPQNIPT